MTGKTIEKNIFDYLADNLSVERYNHTLSVRRLALKLAKYYNANIFNVSTSALLHDCAKSMTFDENIKYIYDNKLKIKDLDFVIAYLPQVLHSYIAADIAQRKFKITDTDVINSIKNHTVGRINMSKCEKIVFIADSLSPDRKYRKNFVDKKTMFGDLEKTFKLVLQNKINYVISGFKVLHPDIVKIWNYYNI